MSRRGGKKPPSFTWCTECEEKAFIKEARGSVLVLDCGHTISAGATLASHRRPEFDERPRLNKGGGKVPTWGARQQAGKQRPLPDIDVTPKRERVAVKLCKHDFAIDRCPHCQQEKVAPPKPAASFDPKRVADLVGDLLKGKKR